MSVSDYHRWLYGDGPYSEDFKTNTSSSFAFRLAPSTGENPKLEVTAPPSFTLSTELYSAVKCFTPKKIIRNGPATVVFWPDNTKTVVKCSDGDKDSTYTAFCAALAQKIFGSNSKIKKMVSKLTEEQKL
jgi:hypothetical protein